MATPAEQRAYVRKLLTIERRFGRLERDTIRRSITLLREFRNRVAGQLSELDNFEQFRLRELQANLEGMIASYETQLRNMSNGAVSGAINLGRSSVIEPLQTVGFNAQFFRASPSQVNVLLDFTADLVTGIGHEVRKRINNQIRISALGEVSSFQAMRDITKILGIPKKASDPAKGIAYEAERILRTETNRAYNLAAHSQRVDLAEQVPGLEQQWLATGDNRTRLSHLQAHGQVVKVGEPFIVGGEELRYPGDPAASAGNTINCRCKAITVIPEIGPVGTPLDDEIDKERAKRDAIERKKFSVADEIALIEKGGYDPYENIRPPAGRAPRGQGKEYTTRRRIVSRIEAHSKWRAIAQEKLDVYRGQVGTRNRWRVDVAKERVLQLDKATTTMLDLANEIASGAFGAPDWGYVDEMTKGIAKYVSELREMSL